MDAGKHSPTEKSEEVLTMDSGQWRDGSLRAKGNSIEYKKLMWQVVKRPAPLQGGILVLKPHLTEASRHMY